ncbi:DUF2505 domain-containing protein [Mariniluteicoccus flavus]
MDISTTADFAADPQTVYAMLTDEAFLTEVAKASGATEHEVAVSGSTTRSKRVLPNPPEMAKFAGPSLTVIEEVVWGEAGPDGSRTGTLDLKVPGQPVTMPGRVSLAPGGRGTQITVNGDLTVKIPLLGKKLEKAAAPAILEGIGIQQQVGDKWLAR